jgi:predicted aspartyl protease
VLPLRLAAPQGGAGIAVVALADTGADVTLIPEILARSLDLPVVSRVRIAGILGAAESAEVLAATVEFAGRSFLTEVVGFGRESIVGRSLLKRLVLRLHGPQGVLFVDARR